MIDEIRDNFEHNLTRVENLVKTYESHPDAQGQGRKSVEVLDILRAAVVLLHATLEDLLRSIARWKLPLASPNILNDIPLVGIGANPKKILLGDLAAHRGKNIEEIITTSVVAYLEHSNFNNTDEIACLLNNVGIDITRVNGTFNTLKELMERRHQIVHRADRQMQVLGSGDHEVRGINKWTVRGWATAVNQFGTTLISLL